MPDPTVLPDPVRAARPTPRCRCSTCRASAAARRRGRASRAPLPRSCSAGSPSAGRPPSGRASWPTTCGPVARPRSTTSTRCPGRCATTSRRHFRFDTLVGTERRAADEGLTDKALHRLDDGRVIESVLMRYPARGSRRERTTLCISSQAGCAVGCPFCATGELGFWRDLETAEIVDQARFWRHALAGDGRRLTNVVFMGMGEPLLNTDAVLAACAALSDEHRFGLGPAAHHDQHERRRARHRAAHRAAPPVHAGGLAPRRAAGAARRARAAQPALPGRRTSCAPRRTTPSATGRRVTYEMVMIDGINDTPADAAAAAALLRGRLAHVNLIPMNPVAHTPWQPSPPERVEAFAAILRAAGLDTTVRRNRGVEIGAACGQLAAERAGAAGPGGRRAAGASCSSSAAQRRSLERRLRAHDRRGRAAVLIAASILTADFGHLDRVVHKLERAGVDRLHLDVMDGHFVANITFGPDVVAAFRRLTEPAARRPPDDLRAGALRRPLHRSRARRRSRSTSRRPRATPTKDAAIAAIRAAGRAPGWRSARGRRSRPSRRARPPRRHHGHDRASRAWAASASCPTRRPRSPRRGSCSLGRPRRLVHVDGGVSRETAAVVGG